MGIRNNPLFKEMLYPIILVAKIIGRNFPEILVRIRYFMRFKRFLNLKHPQTLNEKILYMSLCTDTTLWTRLADKYNVRGYIEECGLSEMLVPLYGHWTNSNDIDLKLLPDSFVLKTTHGCGDIFVVRDKSVLDFDRIKMTLNKSVNSVYGDLEGGKHYMRIIPSIIAEELLVNDDNSKKYSSSLIDYKIWCFNGKPYYIMTCTNRINDSVELQLYDTKWNICDYYIKSSSHYKLGRKIPAPSNLQEMLKVAEKLAKPFPVVRVDLYNINGKIYFGEMTFTSLGGLMNYYTDEFQKITGRLIEL